MPSLRTIARVCLPLLILVACGDMDASETAESGIRIKPTGDDNSPGQLVVKGPDTGGAPLAQTKWKLLSMTGPEKPLGEVFTGLPVGQTTFQVVSIGWGGSAFFDGAAPIQMGAITELTSAGLRIRRVGMPPTLGVNHEEALPTTEFVRESDEATRASVKIGPTADGTNVLAVGMGSYVYRWGVGGQDGVIFRALPGQVTTKDFWDYSQRRVTKIVAPAARELPDACGPASSQTIVVRARNAWSSIEEQRVGISTGTAFEVGENPAILQRIDPGGSRKTVALLPCFSGEIAIPFNAVGGGPNTFALGRADVDDVALTQPDGTTKMVRGRYRIQTPGGQDVLTIQPETNSGVDLPPGTYKIIVEYRTTAGTTGTFTQTFTTP